MPIWLGRYIVLIIGIGIVAIRAGLASPAAIRHRRNVRLGGQ